MGKKQAMHGLTVFIGDIRACKSPEAELKRINKELANIRAKFGDKKGLDGYNRKKYVCKLMFVFLLGHDIEFGHMEAINLLSSVKYSEKQMGYLFVSTLLHEHHDLAKLVAQGVKTDLGSRNELHVCLGLNCIANIAGKDMASMVWVEVSRLLVADQSPSSVKKKAALCLLRFLRKAPETYPHGEIPSQRIVQLLSSSDLGVVTAVASLVIALSQTNPTEYASAVHVTVNRLHRLLMSQESGDYVYYHVPTPWLTVKLIRVLQIFTYPKDRTIATRLNECLNRILARTQQPPPQGAGRQKPKLQYFNAINACFFEAISLIVHYDNDADLQIKACTQLGTFLVHKEPNLRFLALEGLGAMALTEFSQDAVKKHEATVVKALEREKDPTVQRRAVDVLYAICDEQSVKSIVQELVEFLGRSDYAIREELVLKIAILAEKFSTDYRWYVDIVLRLMSIAGDHVAEEVWHRVIQVIINRQDVQDYAAKTCFEALLDPACHEAMISVGGYVLGEFGHLIANDPNSGPTTQFDLLQSHYPMVSANTRGLLLSTFVKFANLFPEIKAQVQAVLKQENLVRNSDSEIQQRANEYLQLTQIPNPSVLPAVLEEMPPFTEKESSILAKLEQSKEVTDRTGTAARRKQSTSNLAAVTAAGHSGGAGGSVTPASAAVSSAQPPASAVTNDQFIGAFMTKMNGVLYENAVLQIGVKCEFHQNLGRLTVFYGNRGDTPMTNVTTRAFVPENQGTLTINAKPIDSTIAPGVQLQQLVQVECSAVFKSMPKLDINLTYGGRPVLLSLTLPVTLNKFLKPLGASLDSDAFFAKWNQLGGPPRETKQIVKASKPIDVATIAPLLSGFGFQPLPGIDPNPNNSVCAAILHTSAGQVGSLLRFEPNLQTQMYRVTLRTSNELVSAALLDLIVAQL